MALAVAAASSLVFDREASDVDAGRKATEGCHVIALKRAEALCSHKCAEHVVEHHADIQSYVRKCGAHLIAPGAVQTSIMSVRGSMMSSLTPVVRLWPKVNSSLIADVWLTANLISIAFRNPDRNMLFHRPPMHCQIFMWLRLNPLPYSRVFSMNTVKYLPDCSLRAILSN